MLRNSCILWRPSKMKCAFFLMGSVTWPSVFSAKVRMAAMAIFFGLMGPAAFPWTWRSCTLSLAQDTSCANTWECPPHPLPMR